MRAKSVKEIYIFFLHHINNYHINYAKFLERQNPFFLALYWLTISCQYSQNVNTPILDQYPMQMKVILGNIALR